VLVFFKHLEIWLLNLDVDFLNLFCLSYKMSKTGSGEVWRVRPDLLWSDSIWLWLNLHSSVSPDIFTVSWKWKLYLPAE